MTLYTLKEKIINTIPNYLFLLAAILIFLSFISSSPDWVSIRLTIGIFSVLIFLMLVIIINTLYIIRKELETHTEKFTTFQQNPIEINELYPVSLNLSSESPTLTKIKNEVLDNCVTGLRELKNNMCISNFPPQNKF